MRAVEWTGTADAPTLTKVEVLEATETSSSAPVFEDVTEAALGALPFWEQELLIGNDAYHQRTDAKVAFFFAGLLGIASLGGGVLLAMVGRDWEVRRVMRGLRGESLV